MLPISQATLVGLGLSASVLGAILPTVQNDANHCMVGHTTCNDDYVYHCDSNNKWVVKEKCVHPSWCNAEADGTVGCVSDTGLKRNAPVDSSVRTLTPTPTSGYSPSHINCREAELRCNGLWEEICDGFGVWQRWRKCSECFNQGEGKADCIPETTLPTPEPTPTFCKKDQLRCNGKWEEICDDDAEWHRLMKCEDCSEDEGGAIDCVPYVDMPPEPTHPAQCVEGTLRCEGNWLDLCNADLSWQRIQQCLECVTDTDGQPFCDNGSVPTSSSSSSSSSTSAPETTPTTSSTPDTSAPTTTSVPTTTLVPTTTSAPATPTPGIVLGIPVMSTPAPHSSVRMAEDNPCFGGEVRCNGDRVEACDAEHVWQDFGPCPSCKQLYNTRDCEPGWQQCAHGSTTVEACTYDGRWATVEACSAEEMCLGMFEGMAFCLAKDIAESEMAKYN
ncbi:hypothetical protein F4813DRAFT_397540 [Daldinia decipiens]|uniref:uncharacterized protein n=1 Tax=Daldinia decipiens TaxID=326647 RepID=UPI0020C39A39|nr:uncharacterized protein F4813DRAFT_397540 [Daldinia decipiens]KAI1656328.1 hypothetical protein F4813DRAFT_397540 [Daldinia decipiens]